MKYVIVILASIVLFSCKKDKVVPTPPIVVDEYPSDLYPDKKIYAPGEMTDGFIQAKKNGLDWKASADATMFIESGKYLLHVAAFTFNKDEIASEAFHFHSMPLASQRYLPYTDTFNIRNPKLIYTDFRRWPSDSCFTQSPALYVDMTANTNYIDVIRVDTVAKIIEARFDVLYVRSRTGGKVEKVRFSEGYMKLKIKKK